jgi:hypothetical protein
MNHTLICIKELVTMTVIALRKSTKSMSRLSLIIYCPLSIAVIIDYILSYRLSITLYCNIHYHIDDPIDLCRNTMKYINTHKHRDAGRK